MSATASTIAIARRHRSQRDVVHTALHHASVAAVLLLLVPQDWMLRIFPYFGQFVFAACIGVAVTALACSLLLPRSCWILMVGTLAWMYLLPNLHRFAGGSSTSLVSARLFVADTLIVLCGFGGWLLASSNSVRGSKLLGAMSLAATAWGALVLGATSAGVLSSTLAGERIGSTSVYLAAGFACSFAPYAWEASRRWWFVVLPSGFAVVAGVASHTRTLIVMGFVTLLAQVAVSPYVRRLDLGYRCALALSLTFMAAPAVGSLLASVAELRGKSVLDSTGRIEEFEDFLAEMSWSDWLFGLGAGGGFWKVGVDDAGMPSEGVSDSLHIGVLTPIIKLGVVASSVLLVLALGRWAWPRQRAVAAPLREQRIEGLMSILVVIITGMFAGTWNPIASFAVGAGLGMRHRPRCPGRAGDPRCALIRPHQRSEITVSA